MLLRLAAAVLSIWNSGCVVVVAACTSFCHKHMRPVKMLFPRFLATSHVLHTLCPQASSSIVFPMKGSWLQGSVWVDWDASGANSNLTSLPLSPAVRISRQQEPGRCC